MRAVDDEPVGGGRFRRHHRAHVVHRTAHGCGVVVRPVDRAAQHHVAVRVAERLHRAGPAHVVDAEERVLLRGGVAAVDGGLDGPVGRVLESDRHRHAAGELAVDLRFGVAGADRAPADRVGDELGAGGLQEFRGGGESFVQHADQRLAREQQALADVVAAVDVGVVDQSLPADRRSRLLEVHAHHDEQFAFGLLHHLRQPVRVVERGVRVVHRAGADDDEQTVVLPIQAGAYLVARVGDDLLRGGVKRQFRQHLGRGGQRFELQHTAVDDTADAHLILPARHARGEQRVLALVHGLPDGPQLLRRVQRLRAGVTRRALRRTLSHVLLLHDVMSPCLVLSPKDKARPCTWPYTGRASPYPPRMTNVPMPRVERARGHYDVLERCRLAGRGVLVVAGRDRDHRQHRQDRLPGSFAP